MALIKLMIVLVVLLMAIPNQPTQTPQQWQPPHHADEWRENPIRGAVVELGYGGPDEFEFPPYPSVESFQQLRALGANVVLIQFQFVWTIDPPYEPIEAQFALVRQALDNAQTAGLYVILSVRNGPGTNSMLSDVDDDDVKTALFTEPDALDAYKRMLQDVVAHFGNRQEIIAWEPLVEPNLNRYLFDNENRPYLQSGEVWNRVAAEMISAIREVDSTRPILISPVNFASTDAFSVLQKFDDDNIVYNLHQYDPYPYTHQNEPHYTSYPGIYYNEFVNRNTLDAWLEPVDAFQAKYDVPIIVGEWGGIRWLPGMARYYADQIGLFEERGWSWMLYAWYDAFWERRGFEPQWGPDRDRQEFDPQNRVFWPILQGWKKNTGADLQ